MQLEPVIAPPEPANLRAICKRIVLGFIEREADLSEKKARIMIAWEHGLITAEEAEEWIVLGGMVEA